MAWFQISRDQLESFKRSWPCHDLPDELDTIAFEYAANGDLIDMDAMNEDGDVLDTHKFDGPAMLALSQDAPKIGRLWAP
jgi:hypothetical protein